MKTVCLIIWISLKTGMPEYATEKPMRSLEECLAWKHQMEFHYSPDPAYVPVYVCEQFREA